jgi:hypothetical protein
MFSVNEREHEWNHVIWCNASAMYKPEVLKLWCETPGGAVGSSGGARVVCTRDIFILKELWTQYKIYMLTDTLLC